MMENEVVMTGMGVVTPIGATVEDFWNANLSGKSGLRQESRMDLSGLPCGWVGAWIPDDIKASVLSRWGRENRSWGDAMMHACVDQALADARIQGGLKRPAGLVWSRVWPGGGGSFPEDYVKHMKKLAWRKKNLGNDIDAIIADLRAAPLQPDTLDSSPFVTEIATRLGSPVISTRLEATCAGGLRAIAEAARLLRMGKADMAIVAVSVSRSNHYVVAQYAQLMALSRWKGMPEFSSTPFDRRRTGMVMNESAGAIVLETAEHAKRRGMNEAYAVVNGWGIAVDTAHITAPNVEMVERVMRTALRESGMTPNEIDVVNAHGTSTKLNDLTEATALHRVFGEHMNAIDVSAVKSLTGHGSAASGVIESVATALTMCRGIVPPVVTCTEPDPECNVRTSLVPIERPVKAVLKNSFGFGGQYASMVFTRPSRPRQQDVS
jgi:3-oxoacyl-[acyl-carrier-protein] synthase II